MLRNGIEIQLMTVSNALRADFLPSTIAATRCDLSIEMNIHILITSFNEECALLTLISTI